MNAPDQSTPATAQEPLREALERLTKRAAEIEALAEKNPSWAIGEAKQHAADLRLILADNERLRGAVEPFALAARAAEVSGRPPFEFVAAQHYDDARQALMGEG